MRGTVQWRSRHPHPVPRSSGPTLGPTGYTAATPRSTRAAGASRRGGPFLPLFDNSHLCPQKFPRRSRPSDAAVRTTTGCPTGLTKKYIGSSAAPSRGPPRSRPPARSSPNSVVSRCSCSRWPSPPALSGPKRRNGERNLLRGSRRRTPFLYTPGPRARPPRPADSMHPRCGRHPNFPGDLRLNLTPRAIGGTAGPFLVTARRRHSRSCGSGPTPSRGSSRPRRRGRHLVLASPASLLFYARPWRPPRVVHLTRQHHYP
mmetsp:Transcript_13704/g.36436  ORF Transcript_13704/g.36436 Transcript_13704/m.36436 type:complete len:259 (+) Transcript_13704:189-965(+)